MTIEELLRAKIELHKNRLCCFTCGCPATQILVGKDSYVGLCDEHVSDIVMGATTEEHDGA